MKKPKNTKKRLKATVSNSCVNVQDSLQIGTRMVAQFRSGQSDNFYKPFSKQVTTMESLKKSITVGDRH